MFDINKLKHDSRLEALNSIEGTVEKYLDNMLVDLGEYWQPADFMPNMGSEEGVEQWRTMKQKAEGLSDELLVALVGDYITEEALPTYHSSINTLEGIYDPTCTSPNVWAAWSRRWSAEENRHGDLLGQYLLLSGRVDMRAVQTTAQNLITTGFNPQISNDPYLGFVYTSFQERATKISHRNTGLMAGQAGAKDLQNICTAICLDEKRHEDTYQFFISELLKIDPEGIIFAFEKMMRQQISMPAQLMTDGIDTNMFDSFSRVTQNIGVYSAKDYSKIVAFLVKKWDLINLTNLSPEAEKARDYLCKLSARYDKLALRMKKPELKSISFSWIHGRSIMA